MQLEFTRLILTDFKEYRGKHVLHLSSLGFGLHYVRGRNRVDALGSNGAGKSTLWDAFMWALTGRTVRGLRGIDVRTWGSEQQAVCRVDFYVGSDSHWVRRSTAKNGLWLDGKLCSQEEIDRLIGLSIISIPHTIVLGQKQELFFDLKPSQKLDVLSETLHLDKWDARSTRAREAFKELDGKASAVAQQLVQFELDAKAISKQLDDIKAQAAAWEKERAQGDTKLEEQRDALTKALSRATAEVGTHDLAYDSAETELRAVRKILLKHAAEMDELVAKRAEAKAKRKAISAELVALMETADTGVCPTCKQVIKDRITHANHAKSQIKETKARLALATDRVTIRETQIELLQTAIDKHRKAELEFGKKSDDAKDKLDRLNDRIADIKQQIAVLKARDRSDEVNPYSDSLTRVRAQIKQMKNDILEAKATLDKLERRMARTKYWIDGFKQVRLYLLQETLEELQEVTQNLLPSVGLGGWIVEYAIERETKTGAVSTGLVVTILKPGMSKAVRWEAWSGGEGQRLLIVGALALSEVLLRRAGIECDLLVLDEPTRHMSAEGVNEIVDHLVERGRDGQIFYVDHQVIESNRFASVITIEKGDEGAAITVET